MKYGFINAVVLICLLSLCYSPVCAQTYFQQEVHYKIDVRLDDKKHVLHAFESIEYKNNAAQPLRFIYFHLWPNAYKNRETALCRQQVKQGNLRLFWAGEKDRGYVDSLEFKVDGSPVELIYDSVNIDICKIILNKPLPPGQTITITTPFRVKIPSAKISRSGHLNQAYYITQWYPKPAVFDKYGWHAMPNIEQGEYYSEFGSFDVNITLPKNYVAGATGDLQNQDELEWLNRKAEDTKKLWAYTDDVTFPPSDTETKTLNYKQNNVHDFAWFADKRFHVLKGEVELPYSKRKVTLWSMFTNTSSSLWKNSIEYMHDAAFYYSKWLGDYPYNQITCIDGTSATGSGMEYPNITIINSSSDANELETVMMHEIGHNWFYGILGSNERMHGWMDEGINTFYEMRYMYTKYPGEKGKGRNDLNDGSLLPKLFSFDKPDHKTAVYYMYLYKARTNSDQPIELPSEDFSEINYGLILYGKTGLAFDYLKSYLGDSLFDACMQTYYETWKFKHPYPDDIRKIFEEKSKADLKWFFDDLLQTTKKTDYKICHVAETENQISVMLKNKTGLKSPVEISFYKNNGDTNTLIVSGFDGKQTLRFKNDNYEKVEINTHLTMPEINRKNNTMRMHGIFRKWNVPQLQLFTDLEKPDRTQIFAMPVIGWNNYDKTMLGAAFYNHNIISKNFEYLFMPLYSFGQNKLNGKTGFNYGYHDLKAGSFEFSMYAQRYFIYEGDVYVNNTVKQNAAVDFVKLNPEIKFTLRNHSANSTLKHEFSYSHDFIWLNDNFEIQNDVFKQSYSKQNYDALKYLFANKRALDPFSASAKIEAGKDYANVKAELNYNFSFRHERRGVSVRFFTGAFIYHKDDAPVALQMSGFTGNQDYRFENIYLGRTETDGIYSKQFVERDGGFKIYSPVGRTTKWLSSLNVKAKFPGLPVLIYMDLGTYDGAATAYDGSQLIMYNGGVCLSLIRDVVEVYFPLFQSSDIKQYYEVNDIDKFKEKIRFQLNLNLLDPFELRKQLYN